MKFITIIDLVTLSQGILLGILILVNKPSSLKAYTYLAIYIMLLGLESLSPVFEDLGVIDAYPALYFLPIHFYFTFPVFFYLYTREISGFKKSKVTWKWFVPGAIEFLTWSVLLVIVISGRIIDPDEDLYVIFEGFYYLASFIFMIYYLVKIIRFISKVKNVAENNFSSLTSKTLSWLRVGCWLILIIFLSSLPGMFMEEEGNYWLWHDYFSTIVNSVMVFWLAIHGYRQTVILNFQSNSEPHAAEDTPLKEGNVSQVIPLEGDKKLFEEIVSLVEEKELYKQQELTLNELAKEAGIHQKQLSFLINQFSEMNFFNFINSFRVKEAQELLIDDKYDHLSFIGIAFEAGFNSKATFNATFKRITGQTPRQYKMSKQSA